MRTIALVDHTRQHRPPSGALAAIAEALTRQVSRDFAPAWGIATVRFTVGGRGEKIHFFDSAHQAGEYGWHTVDNHGLPYAHVFVGPSIEAGSSWVIGTDAVSASASHEALELLCDPCANEYSYDGFKRLWAREVCDPVQERSYAIVAMGMRVTVSNFVRPDYFNPWSSGPFDHMGVLKAPFAIDRGGYAVYQHSGATRQRNRRAFHAVFDDAMPAWKQEQKLNGWGRTYWRLALSG